MFAVFVILPQFCLILLGYLLTGRPSFCQKRFLDRYGKAGLLAPVSSSDLSFGCKGKPPNRTVQLLFADIDISHERCGDYSVAGELLIKESPWTKWSIFHCGFRFNTYIGFAIYQRFSAIKVSPTFHS